MSRNLDSKIPDSPELSAYKEEVKNSVNQMLAKTTLILKAGKVAKVVVDYQGGNDDGSIESVTYYNKDGEEFDPELPTRSVVPKPWDPEHVEDKIEEVFYSILEVRGWEVNNAGSQGAFVWDIEKDTFVHNHGSNFYDTEADTDSEGRDRDDEDFNQPLRTEEAEFLGLDDLEGRWHEG
jgi:hypothetical protein